MKLSSLLLSPFSLLLVSCAVLRAAEPRPNILYILADDLGYGDLSCYGQQRVATPHLDRLAAEGMRFTQHYSGTTVCAPSRAAFLEGRHTGHTSVRGNQPPHLLDPRVTTLPEALKQAGYATAIIGKWGLGHPPPPDDPARHGFDYAFGYVNMWHAHNFFPEFLYRNGQKVPLPGNVTDRTLGFNDLPEGTGVAKHKVTYAPHALTRDALDYLDRDHRAPFFLFFALNLPHDNGEAFKATGDGNEVPDYGEFARRDWPQPDRGYARMLQIMDETVGQVLAKLDARGLTANTLVVFSSDNGGSKGSGRNFDFFQSNGPLRGIKRDLYEGGIRVPCIARWPGRIPAGRVSQHVSATWDLYPTFCDAVGVIPPAGLDGISFLPTLLGHGTQRQHAYLYWEFYEQGGSQAVRQGQWKAVRRHIKTGTEAFELYDLDADLAESRNLAAAQPTIAARLRALMAEAHTPHPVLTFSRSQPAAK